MPLTVTVELISGSYEAGDAEDRGHAEWPPHPARIFCALVAAARTEHERTVLGWLEEQAPPVVCAAAGVESQRRSGFVVTNEVTTKAGSQTHPARTNGLRLRSRAVPAASTVRFVWPQTDAEPDMVAALDTMARRVPYFGRSTGIALVTVTGDEQIPAPAVVGAAAGAGSGGNAEPEWAVYEPCDLLEAQESLRVPYPTYLQQLDAQFDAGRPAWEVSRFRGYRLRTAAVADRSDWVVPSAYTDVVVLRFAGLRPDGRLAARFTEALRSRVLRRLGDAAPAELHGHGADGRPHVAFLALPHVDADHADGHLLGLAVAVPELLAAQRRVVLGGVLGLRNPESAPEKAGVVELLVPGLGWVDLAYEPGLVRPWGASPERWRRGSRRWVTATPVVLDRFPKKGREAAEIARCFRTAGLPEPVDIQVSSDPLTQGAARLRPVDLPKQVRGRLFRHVAVEFDRKVSGPLMVGAGRYLGVGLFAPIVERAA